MTPEITLQAPVTRINGSQFKWLLAGGIAMLEQNYQYVNKLNVFPVPDGDTGTNMLMTLRNAWKFIADINEPEGEFGKVATQFARGAIRGSRGNSGTILSELLRGFASEVHGLPHADLPVLMRAFRAAVQTAYSVVEKPVEGTILTVAREVAEEIEASATSTQDLIELLQRVTHRAKVSVAQTPDLLPILRKAGVVDSGGQGLAYFFEGMYRHALGESLQIVGGALELEVMKTTPLSEVLQAEDPEGYGYDVQFLVMGKNLDVGTIRTAINNMGVSGVITGDDSVVKVHIHVHDPGVPLSYGVSMGAITDVVVENMQLQAEDYIAGRSESAQTAATESESLEPGLIAVVAVAPGDGFRRILLSMGAAVVIDGGQTMNPSSGEFISAIEALPAANVIILPNNKNIILTAEQASKELPDKHIQVIPTRTMPQGIAAMLSFDADGVPEAVVAGMEEAAHEIITGEVTTASRTVSIDGVDVQEGQIIGLIDGKLRLSAPDVSTALHDLLNHIVTPIHELVTLYYGADVNEDDSTALVEKLQTQFPNLQFDLNRGEQPHYPYIFSVE